MTEEKQFWTMEELLSITEKVQEAEVEYGEKSLKIQWCELTEAEEPKLVIPDESLPEETKTKMYVDMASDRVIAMMKKAEDKNPEGQVLVLDQWKNLTTNLRYNIQNKILGAGTNFQSG